MPLADKNILITPNRGQAADPTIVFSGANVSVGPQNITATALPLSNGTVSFSGSAGQLFSITNSLTGSIFSVNDVSGIPSIEVNSSGVVTLAQFSGNVGIGTGTPTQKLTVTGNIQLNSSGQVNFFDTNYFVRASTGLELQSLDLIRFLTNGANERMRITATGLVGIGTNSPTSGYPLTVFDSINGGIVLQNASNFSGVAQNGNDVFFDIGRGGVSGALVFRRSSALNESMRITAAGDVGIGTTSPGARLTVNGGNYRQVTAATGGTSGYELFDAASGGNHIGSFTRRDNGIGIASFDYVSFWTGATTGISTGSERMRLLTNGNLGIGTVSPAVRLQVVGASILANNTGIDPDDYANQVVAGAIADGSGFGLTSAIGGNAGAGDSWALGHNGSGLFLGVGNGTEPNSVVTYLQGDPNRNIYLAPGSGGRVAIGNTSPAVTLDMGTRTDAIRTPVGTTAQRPATAATGQLRYNTSVSSFEGSNGSQWFTIPFASQGSQLNPATSPQQLQNLGFASGAYWYQSGSMSTAIQLTTTMNLADGRPWVLVFQSPFASTATINQVGNNIPWKGFLFQRTDGVNRGFGYFATQQLFNTRSDTATTTSGTYTGFRVFIGQAGGHGFYNTGQAPCNWPNAVGALGAGFDGSCGSWPNALRWGTGQSGNPNYNMDTGGTYQTWLWWD